MVRRSQFYTVKKPAGLEHETALVMPSNNCELKTCPLVRESTTYQQIRNSHTNETLVSLKLERKSTVERSGTQRKGNVPR
jgi:hypothetical protein